MGYVLCNGIYSLCSEKSRRKDQDFVSNNSPTREKIRSKRIYFPPGIWANITGMGLGPGDPASNDPAGPT